MSIQYPKGTDAKLGVPDQVAPGVYRFAIPLPERLALGHINAWILKDGDGWTLVESGFDCDEARQAWIRLKDQFLGGKPVKRLILTHHHVDHIGLSHWLQQLLQTEVYVSETELSFMSAFHQRTGLWGKDEQQRYFNRLGFDSREQAAVEEFLATIAQGMGPMPEDPQMIIKGQLFEVDGRRWQVINLVGHSPDQCTLYCPELKLWIGADQLLPHLSTYAGMEPGVLMDIDTLEQLRDSLEQLKPLPEDLLVLPAHGAPFVGVHRRARSVWRNYQRLAKQLQQCCQQLQQQNGRAASVMEIRRQLIPDSLYYSSPFFVTAKLASTLRYQANRGLLDVELDDAGRLRYSG